MGALLASESPPTWAVRTSTLKPQTAAPPPQHSPRTVLRSAGLDRMDVRENTAGDEGAKGNRRRCVWREWVVGSPSVQPPITS